VRVAYLQKITCQPGLRTGESFFEEMELLTERTNYAGRVRTNHVGSRTATAGYRLLMACALS
jgi:hypothetical protein